jgi:acyl-CoA synthetase (AMP-forming)/AMP-acid ligase II
MLRDQASRSPGAVVVADGGAALTLGQLRSEALRLAQALIGFGVAPGDRVAIMIPNGLRWVVSAFAVWDAGGVVVPVSTRFKGVETREFLTRTQASVLLTSDELPGGSLLSMLAAAVGEPAAGRPYARLPDLRAVVLDGPGGLARGEPGPLADPAAPARPGVLRLGDFAGRGHEVDAGVAEERALAVAPGDMCEILSTSGTTGTPKGVVLDHAQVLRAYWDWSEIVTLGPGDRYPVIAPFSHGFGLNAGLLACVLRAATLIPVAVFDPDALVDLIERERVSVLAGPPTLFHRLLDRLAGGHHDVSPLRVAVCGAAAVPPELIRRLIGEAGVERMINAYGLIEGTVVSMTRAGDPVEVVAATAGRAVPGVSIKIVDDAGAELPAGQRGEILVAGYGVMRGYWQDEEKTAAAVDAAGWLHTGDVGTLDDAGNLAIVDRKKEMFNVGGFSAYPAEIEALLLHHGGLGQAAVIGVPDAALGEAGWAYVVPRPGATVDPAGLISWARQNMSNYKVPRRVVVVDALPVNANGKVDKEALRRAATA